MASNVLLSCCEPHYNYKRIWTRDCLETQGPRLARLAEEPERNRQEAGEGQLFIGDGLIVVPVALVAAGGAQVTTQEVTLTSGGQRLRARRGGTGPTRAAFAGSEQAVAITFHRTEVIVGPGAGRAGGSPLTGSPGVGGGSGPCLDPGPALSPGHGKQVAIFQPAPSWALRTRT